MRFRVVLCSLVMCFGVASVGFAGSLSYSFFGTQQPAPPSTNSGPSHFNGQNCDPSTVGCIFNSSLPNEFRPFSAILGQDPSDLTGTKWILTIQTNAPVNYVDSMNHGSTPIGGPIVQTIFGDALIQYGMDQNGQPVNWGLGIGSSMADNNTTLPSQITTAGALYDVNKNFDGSVRYTYNSSPSSQPEMYLVAGIGIGAYTPPSPGGPFGLNMAGGRSNEPVWINPDDMTQVVGASSLGIAKGNCGDTVQTASGVFGTPDSGALGCGSTYALYTITDAFTAPVGFLSTGVFSFEFSSFLCANGLIIGNSGSSGVPEPRTVSFLVVGMLLLVSRLTRLRKAQVS
jgi:hypothetical protein